MTGHALEPLLAPISDDAPTGEDLEYDQAFMALDRAATAKSERVVGDSVKAAEEPDWASVATQAEGLLTRSKDLRVAVHLATAWMRTDGWPGWADGLGLVRALLEQFWDAVHPQLDAEDDNDPTSRVNAIMPISDMQGALGYLRTTPFVASPRLGRYSLRDVHIADGTLKVPPNEDGTPAPTATDIEACCLDCPEAELAAVVDAVNAALEHAQAIDALFTEKVGTAGPDLKPLLAEMQALKKFVVPQLARRRPDAAADGAEAEGGDGEAAAGAAGVAASTGRISGPQDVLKRIDELCEYYDRNEPSSPVPLLLRRAQRLVGKNFLDLLGELAPSGVNEMQVISGAPPEE